jgi:predicted ATPase/DNA-binding NarL/FixJ family response regulator
MNLPDCPRCGRQNRLGAAYCDGCGTSLRTPACAPDAHGGAVPEGDTFVGRERERTRFANVLARTVAGRGGLLMLVGEPGIGKTRSAHAFALQAAEQGVQVLWGRCHEEPGAPPYWPWLQLLRAWVGAADDERLHEAMGSGANLVAEILPDVADRMPGLPPVTPATDAAHERFRLFDAITGFWQRAAQLQPLLLVLDDLHWADTASLKLLEFLAADLGGSRLLLLGTYRDIALSRQHPLSDALGELARHPWFERLPLTGLSLEETAQFMAVAAGRVPAEDLVAALHRQTDGNPLFLLEITRHLAHQGALHAGTGSGLRHIPEGVREVIGTRLNRLSLQCNSVLSSAAVIGRSFSTAVLVRVLDGAAADECLAALDEALTARLIEELPEPGSFQFSHALIRDTLYDEMPALRRIRLHQRIAAALEETGRRDLTHHLSALAYHYGAALPGHGKATAAKAVEYARRAGERADSLLAYEHAAHCYRLALNGLALQAPEGGGQRVALLLALGRVLTKAGENIQALEVFQEAAQEARSLGDARRFAWAAIGFEDASSRPGQPGHTAARLLREALALLEEQDSTLRAQLLACLSRALVFTGALAEAGELLEQAMAMAHRIGDPATLAAVHRAGLAARWQPERLQARVAAAGAVIQLAEQAGDSAQMVDALGWRMFDLMEIGDVNAAARDAEAQTRLAEALRQPWYIYIGTSFRATAALLRGEFAESERLAAQALALGQRLPGQDVSGVFGVLMFSLRREQGRLQELAPLVRQFAEATPRARTWRPALALVYTELGLLEEARAEFSSLATDDFAAVPRDGLWPACIAYLAEVCAALGDRRGAETLYRLLLPYDGHNVVVGACAACYGAAARFLGMLAATLEHWELAERHLDAAITMNARQRARPWLAHSQYQLAATLLRRGRREDNARARAALNEALTTSRALGMGGLEQRAQRLQQQFGRRAETPVPPAGLSQREVQVLRLIAVGKSNREVASQLFLSQNTVANHVRNILAKTGSANRTEAAAFASRHRLLGEAEGT